MKKLLAILMAMMMVMSLVACGGSDDTAVEEEVYEEVDTLAVMEEAATLLADALVSAVWIDEEYTVFGFYDDGSMEMQSVEGDVYYATFTVGYDEADLYMIIEGDEFGTLVYYIDIDSLSTGAIGMIDENGNVTAWAPVE